jgi:predicted pyridoxine 5'-phosphate oxidase superfamily flavin-nucleotide-binding protein
MDSETLREVKALARKAKRVYVATTDQEGTPHIAAAEGFSFIDEDRILFSAWFCLETVKNLEENPKIALAFLDPRKNKGYQLWGEMERIERGAILNGFSPEIDEKWKGYPQAEHQLYIRLVKVSPFSSGPHSDEFLP